MDNSPSLQKYIDIHLSDRLLKAIAHFLHSTNPSALGLRLGTVQEVGSIDLNYIDLKAMDIGDLPGSAIEFDVVAEAMLTVSEKGYEYNGRWELAQQRFTLRCRGDLACGLEDLEIYDVHVYDKRNPQSRPMSYALVPIVHKEDLEHEAETFLAKYYKEALEKPMPIDTNELARRMGLTVISHRISEDASIFGQIYFMASEPKLCDSNQDDTAEPIKPGTIVVDPLVSYQRNIGSRNNTIVHECVHWDLHRKAFMLKRLLHQNASQIQCRVVGGIQGESDESTRYAEWQANALAPRIQMPLVTFRQQAASTIERYRKKLGAIELCELMPYVIADLADFFGVSKMAAKLRMVEAGYKDAKCALIYLDGHYVKPFMHKKGSIRDDQTYCISTEDAVDQLNDNPLMQKATHYTHIDSHFVLDHPKYVHHGEDGKTQMTDYARYHIDECCLVFDLVISSRVEEHYRHEYFLNRDKGTPFPCKVVYMGENGELDAAQQDKLSDEKVNEEADILCRLPNDSAGAWAMVLKWRNITREKLSEVTGISERTIYNIIHGKTEGSIDYLVMMCIAAKLPWDISEYILGLSGRKLLPSDRKQRYYRYVLQAMNTQSLKEVQDYLASRNPSIRLGAQKKKGKENLYFQRTLLILC